MGIISKSDLSTVYAEKYFTEGESSVSIIEHNRTKDDDLETVRIVGIDGHYLQIKDCWLKDSSKPYRAEFAGLKMFRKDCDSIVLLNHKGSNYAIWMEMKSGYEGATKSAMFQIVGSYIRTKSYLNAFSAYKEDDYKELALVIGHCKQSLEDESSENELIMCNKRMITSCETKTDSLAQQYRRKLVANEGVTMLSGKDFAFDILPLRSSVLFRELPLVHFAVEGTSVNIDIEKLLEKLNDLISV